METETRACRVQGLAKSDLGLGVFGPPAAQRLAARCRYPRWAHPSILNMSMTRARGVGVTGGRLPL